MASYDVIDTTVHGFWKVQISSPDLFSISFAGIGYGVNRLYIVEVDLAEYPD